MVCVSGGWKVEVGIRRQCCRVRRERVCRGSQHLATSTEESLSEMVIQFPVLILSQQVKSIYSEASDVMLTWNFNTG